MCPDRRFRARFIYGQAFCNTLWEKNLRSQQGKNIYSHQIKAKSAGQRERRADVTTRKKLKQGRFVSEI